jgi:hypothetical protein
MGHERGHVRREITEEVEVVEIQLRNFRHRALLRRAARIPEFQAESTEDFSVGNLEAQQFLQSSPTGVSQGVTPACQTGEQTLARGFVQLLSDGWALRHCTLPVVDVEQDIVDVEALTGVLSEGSQESRERREGGTELLSQVLR